MGRGWFGVKHKHMGVRQTAQMAAAVVLIIVNHADRRHLSLFLSFMDSAGDYS